MAIVKINGMSCQHCVGTVTKALESIDGVSDVNVDLAKGEASFAGDNKLDAVKQAIKKVGFEPVE